MTTYTVQRGDSLWEIAQKHGTTVDEIARANGITNPDRIAAGQQLRLPSASATGHPMAAKSVSTPTPKALSPAQESHWWSEISVEFVDAVQRPIKDLEVMIQAGARRISGWTDELGRLPIFNIDRPNTPIIVKVQKIAGGEKEVARVTPSLGTNHVQLRSPKVLVQGAPRVHQAPAATAPATRSSSPAPAARRPSAAPPSSPAAQRVGGAASAVGTAAGTIASTRSAGGNPVLQVSIECPNNENLKLGPNAKYRQIIINAGTRSGLSAHSICAIMNAEAARIRRRETTVVTDRRGNPVIDKATKKPKTRTRWVDTGEWDAASSNPRSSARGMTQFLDDTWIGVAWQRNSHLNQKARERNWVKDESGRQVFVLADGKTLNSSSKIRQKISSRATSSDANVQALLNLRLDAECAINAAVDYGLQNLAQLESSGFKFSTINDGEKAKFFYLTHHLGSGDAVKFIMNSMTAERAEYLLGVQVTTARAAALAAEHKNDYLLAHRAWLKSFIDSKIDGSGFACDATKLPTVRGLSPLLAAVGGKDE
jgi:murein DD-endopeptidase MepM/ murein hydrolase activator NlpD